MIARRFSFALLLPLLELTLWAALVPTQATLNAVHWRQQSHGADTVRLHSGAFQVNIPRKRLFAFALERVAFVEAPSSALSICRGLLVTLSNR